MQEVDERFKRGLELFNERDYFESHEVIEDLWLETPSDDPARDLYKGVIQAAAAIYQFDRQILSGAIGLYKTCVPYLEKYAPESHGLNVRKLVDDLKVCFADLEKWDGKSHVGRYDYLTPRLNYSFKNHTIKPHHCQPKKHGH